MKMYLLSDNRDTLTGLRIAGIKGILVSGTDDARERLEELLNNPDVGIILITEKLGGSMRDKISFIKQKLPMPLIVEIPDRHGSIKDSEYIVNYVRDSIGIKV